MGGKTVGEEAPDLVGYITGLRAWRFAESDAGWRLQSAIQNLIWPTKERLEAECLVTKMPTHPMVPSPRPIPHQDPPPHEPCKCGFWGLAEPNELYTQYGRRAIRQVGPDSERYVYGTVALWGRVVTGTKGWRSQYAFPLALVLEAASLNNRGLLSRLAETYGIPVVQNWPEASELVANA